jgi:Zn ribbon nucleic-acid-binding protein
MMDGLPATAIEFERKFATEKDCIRFLREQRWEAGFRCPSCGGNKAWQLAARPLDECAACGHQVSITAGTIFEGTRRPLVEWFRVIAEFVVSKRGISAQEIQRRFGMTYKTAWTWLHKIRSTMDRVGGAKLNGKVEMDETYIGGEDPPEKKGRSVAGKKTPVLAAVEDRGECCGRLRLEFAGGATKEDIQDFVERNIEKGSEIRTDGWGGYNDLESTGYKREKHIVGNGKNAPKVLPKVHRVFSLIRRWLLGTYHGSASVTHLKRYLDEYVFRFNRRSASNRWHLFGRVIEAAFITPPTFRELVGRGSQDVVAT